MKKRRLALLLAVLMVISILPVSALAVDETEVQSGTCGENLTWTLVDGTLTISGTGDMDNYGSPPWGGNITNVIINEGVTSVGSCAFSYTSVQSVSLPNSLLTIGVQAFKHCLNLASITIPEHVTKIRSEAFFNCTSLASVVIPNSVTTIEQKALGFYSAEAKDETLEEGFTIYGYSDTAADTYAEENDIRFVSLGANVAGYCGENVRWALDEDGTLTISGAGAMSDFESYGYGSRAPWYCVQESISKVVIEDGVDNIGTYAFSGCTNLSSVRIPGSVTSMNTSAFRNCSSLTSISIPASVTSFGKYLFESSGLTSVTIPSGMTSIREGMFDKCTGLTSITIPAHVTSIESFAFYACWGLPSVRIENPACEIAAGAYTLGFPDTTVIYGYTGSTAEAYANEYGYEFVAIDGGTDPATWSNPYTDVKETAWYYDSVSFAAQRGLFYGTTDTTFSPNGKMTRAMIVAVLYRLEGSPAVSGGTAFTDVPLNAYYANAVKWANANGIVYGTSTDKFSPSANVTREQMVTFLYRYAKYKGIDISSEDSLSTFPDASQISSYARPAFVWAVGADVIHGSDGKLLPRGTATRAEVATMLMNFVENILEK